MKCCKIRTVIVVNGNKFCKEHFIKYYERKVEKVIKKIQLENKKILVAVSGGKDSMALAFLLNKFSKQYGFNMRLLFIDLGIHEYSKKSKEVVERFAKKHSIKLNIINAKKEIFSIDEVNELKEKSIKERRREKEKTRQIQKHPRLPKPICSYCGLIKRYLINKFAYENGFDYVAIGHNLDDELAFLFMNMTNQNLEQLLRTNIVTETNKKLKLVGRIKPLYFCSEKEDMVYCLIKSIKFYNGECPHATNSTQIAFKHLINNLEQEKPGFKLNFLSTFLKLKQNLKQGQRYKQEVKQCKICGYATTLDVCAFCRFRNLLKLN